MSPWLIAGAAGAALAALLAVQTARLDAAQTREAQQRDRADHNARTVNQMLADRERDARISADLAAQIAALKEQDIALRNRIAAAADSTSCSDSDAMRELLRGVRRERGAPDPAGTPPAR